MQPIFDFKLLPTDVAIKQSGLTWFWLTDGFYWINIENQRLFELTDEVLSYWGVETSNNAEKCMSYQVVRLWEDMLEILPTIIRPVPRIVHELFLQIENCYEDDGDLWWDYVEKLNSHHDSVEEIPFYTDGHVLSAMHVACSPLIYFWRYQENQKDEMWIGWDFSQTIDDENTGQQISLWTANKGLAKVDYDIFINHFINFDKKLMDEMWIKIDEILNSSFLQSLYLDNYDFSILTNEHNERQKELSKALNNPKTIHWEQAIYHYQQAGII